jgi:glycosyltransferase involved in cell wall biosynthesis
MSPVLSIVMLVHNRPRLTRQALESLARNTRGPHHVLIVDDGSGDETRALCCAYAQCNTWDLIVNVSAVGPGAARNQGIRQLAQRYDRGLLYSADNDCWFGPGWDETLLKCWNAPERAQERFEALGAYAHPFQRRGRLISNPGAMAGHSIAELEALGLFSWLMVWETFDKYGPFAASPTVNGSEDWAFCQKIRAGGGRVGVVEPALVINCGIVSSDGKPCPGAALLYDQNIPSGVILE